MTAARRKPMSVGELNAMPRVTPTALAEAAYGARSVRLVNGVPVPGTRYRPKESDLLRRLTKEAAEAHVAANVPTDWLAQVGAEVEAYFEEAFPRADMEVLGLYGCARAARTLQLSYGSVADKVAIAAPRLLPTALTDFAGIVWVTDTPITGRQVLLPQAAQAILDQRAEVIDQRFVLFERAHGWVAGRRRSDAPLTWADIEAEFPSFGAWMADRRAADTRKAVL